MGTTFHLQVHSTQITTGIVADVFQSGLSGQRFGCVPGNWCTIILEAISALAREMCFRLVLGIEFNSM